MAEFAPLQLEMVMELEETEHPNLFRQPSEFLRSLVTNLLYYCTELESQDPQSCHGRLVQDICLDLPALKTSQFSQLKKAVLDEAKVTDQLQFSIKNNMISRPITFIFQFKENERKSSKVHNCFAHHEETEEKTVTSDCLPENEEILEMTDNDGVIDYKLERLVNLLRLSRRTVVFTRSPYTNDKHYGTECGIRFHLLCVVKILRLVLSV